MNKIPNEVIGRFAFKNNISFSEAELIFDELEDFLKLSTLQKLTPASNIDTAWHEFILHSLLYEKYCNEVLGKMIYHVPTSPYINQKNIIEKATASADTDCQSNCGSCNSYLNN